jgi:hypothetical protein
VTSDQDDNQFQPVLDRYDNEFRPVFLGTPAYGTTTSGAVEYVQVGYGGIVFGYVWASVTDNAAGFVPTPRGVRAAPSWEGTFIHLHQQGVSARDALDWIAHGPGGGPSGGNATGEPQHADNLAALHAAAATAN